LLAKHSKGLIALGCLRGPVTEASWNRNTTKRARMLPFARVFGAKAISSSEIRIRGAGRKRCQPANWSVFRKKPVYRRRTNDCHYLHHEDAHAQEVLLCIQTGKTIATPIE